MKNLFVLLLLALAAVLPKSAFSANELFRSAASGNWNLTSTWEMSTNGGGVWFAATSVPHDSSGATTVRSSNTVTVTVSTSSDQLTIEGGATLTINNGIILTVPNGSGNDITANPSGTVNGTGTVRTTGGSQVNLRAGSLFSAQLNVSSGSSNVYDFSSPFDGTLYGNLIIDSGAVVNGGPTSGFSLTIHGNITNNGSLVATSTGGFLSMKGQSIVNNGSIVSSGWFYFDSVTAISGSGTFTSANQSINANGNVTLMSNVTISPTSGLSVQTGGDLNLNGYVLTFNSGQFAAYSGSSVNAPGTFRTQGSVSVYPVSGSNFNADFNVNTGSSTGGNTGSGDNFYGNVTINSGATMNCGSTSGRRTNFYGNVTNNGTLTTSSTGGNIVIKGPALVNSGSINALGNFYFDSTTSVSGSGTFTSANQYITPLGNVTLMSDVTIAPTSALTMQAGAAVLNLNGFVMTYNSGTFNLNAGNTVNGPGMVRTQNNVAIYVGNSSAFNADIKVDEGTLTSGTTTVDRFFGNITIDNGASYNCGTTLGRRTDFYGGITNNGTLYTSSTGATIRYKGPSLVNNGLVSLASGNFYFDTTATLSGTGSFTSHANFSLNANVTLNSTHQMTSMTVNAGTIFNITNRLLKVTASNPIGVVSGGTIVTTGSTIEYNGTAAQSISIPNIPYAGLRINNSNGAFLPGDVSVSDTLSVVMGDLDLNGKIITLSSTGYLTETPGNTVKGSSGFITTTRTLNAPSSLNVAGLGAVLTTSANLGNTTITRGHTPQIGPFVGTGIQRYYDVTPFNNNGLNATLVFKYDDSELNGNNENILALSSSTNAGTNWTNRGGTPDPVNNEVTISNLNSFSRWAASDNRVNAVIGLVMEGFYNPVTNRLNMKDTVRVYLRNTNSPYSIVDSAKGVVDSVQLAVQLLFSNAAPGTYYVQVRHRNSIETWSKSGGEVYQPFITLQYDFKTSAANAFGSNQAQVDSSPLRFALYSGDANQDGTIDATDLSLIDNDATNFLTGYLQTDITGDGFTDGTDYSIADNNAYNFVSVVRP